VRPGRKRSPPEIRRAHERSLSPVKRSDAALQVQQSFWTIIGSARAHDAAVRRLCGMSDSQLRALSEIAAHSGTTVDDQAAQRALHPTSTSDLVNALVVRKYVRRARDRADRRVFHLWPAAEGKRTLRRLPGPHAGLLSNALRHLDVDNLARLRETLAKLMSQMR